MSGEYYCTPEPLSKFYKEGENPSPKLPSHRDGSDQNKDKGHRLHDIEEQLEMAENRCNTLKDQLDYMKQIYGAKKQIAKSRNKNTSPSKKLSDENLTASSVSIASGDNKTFPKRQNSYAIGTDNTGAAVRTINNILNGITESVNRLSELHVQVTETPRSKGDSRTPLQIHATNLSQTQSRKSFIDDSEVPSAVKVVGISNKSKNIKRKLKESKLATRKLGSSQSIKRSCKVDRRSKPNVKRETIVEKQYIPTMTTKRDVLRSAKAKSPEKLVEIYHNKEARNSDSDEGHNTRVKSRLSENNSEDIPPLDIPKQFVVRKNSVSKGGCNDSTALGDRLESETYFDPPEAPRDMQSYYKSYALPTIASRMKQVAKSYLNVFNFKAIPFCAAISTSPSHNIGINIQQVMNIIKNRQTVNGISPTLAHNIGLAAERINSRPLSALVSTINSRTSYKPSQCPLSKPSLNYHHLQEMARGIPEETAEEVEGEGEADSPETKTVLITGPSGDMEVRTRNAPTWSATAATSATERCTCVSQPTGEFERVADRYRRNGTALTTMSSAVRYEKNRSKQEKKKPRLLPRRPSAASNNEYLIEEQKNQAVENPLQGKEKNLKEVLMNLHNEFESLNKRYEELSQKADADDVDTLKELEGLESELNRKEEEITMVMTLYKEVLALKQQIKTLKQKTSQSSVTFQEQGEPSTPAKFKEYNNPQAAFHLTKLLKQIQTYQMRYKKE